MKKQFNKSIKIVVLFIFLLALLVPTAAWAENAGVKIVVGPTPIINGSALGANDLTMFNENLAISIAVDTAPPWGVPKGSILDAAVIQNGAMQSDKITLIDFLPNAWAAWPNTYQKVTIAENTPERGVIKVERDYNEIRLVTTYTLEKGSKYVKIKTVATNPPEGKVYKDLYPGYSFCTTGGYMFGPYGLSSAKNDLGYNEVNEPYGKYVLGYDEGYAIGMHFANANFHDGGTGWKDLYQKVTFSPGEEKVFESVVQFEPGASTSPFLKTAAEQKGDSFGTISGTIQPKGATIVANPILVVEKNNQPLAWVVGKDGLYSIDLPEGDYTVYAVAKDYSPSVKVPVTVVKGQNLKKDFSDLLAASNVAVTVTGKDSKIPVNARIKVTGGTPPVVGFLGASTFFTDLKNPGIANFKLVPGDYQLEVTSGEKFLTKKQVIPVVIKPGEDIQVKAEIQTRFYPSVYGWFSSDLHHHSNILDGITDPTALVQSQLASRLDFTFVSDHDSIKNNKEISDISSTRKVPSISAVEVSPIWAHFVVLPLDFTKPLAIDPAGTATEIINQAHQAGAVISLAHPYIAYGYFYSAEADKIPGGYDPNFDLIELQSTKVTSKGNSPDEKTLAKVWSLWNESLDGKYKKYYLTGGTDTHDVWNSVSGRIRTYAYIKGEPTPEGYINALKAGNSYVTEGPLVETSKMFGETFTVEKGGKFTIRIQALAVDGVKKVMVISEGKVVALRNFEGKTDKEHMTFALSPEGTTWYSFIVEDVNGNRAVTNPVWVNVVSK